MSAAETSRSSQDQGNLPAGWYRVEFREARVDRYGGQPNVWVTAEITTPGPYFGREFEPRISIKRKSQGVFADLMLACGFGRRWFVAAPTLDQLVDGMNGQEVAVELWRGNMVVGARRVFA
jgi:hypothetical protein